ncbi:MAG: helix-turn-helix domain-containing protein [Candidatus Woesearchaeota archaeon]
MECIAYYDKKTEEILDFLPKNIDNSFQSRILELWSQDIPKKILQYLSTEENVTAPKIKNAIGHSVSTLHENIKKLEESGLIETKMIYVGNKQKVIKPKVIFVTKNPKFRSVVKNFLSRGIWIDSERSRKVINFLQENHKRSFTAEEISSRTGVPVDEIHNLLGNWDSQITRAFSDFLKEKPFEKKIMYKGKKPSNKDDGKGSFLF